MARHCIWNLFAIKTLLGRAGQRTGAPSMGALLSSARVSSDRSGQSPLLSEPQRYFFALAFSRAAASARTVSGSSLNRSRQPEQQTQ